jgi:hypothetical protein
MNNTTKILLLLLVAILASLYIATGTGKASELSDFKHAVAQQNTVRGAAILKDLAYSYGGYDRMITKMNYLETQPTVAINSFTVHNHETGEDVFNGYWVVTQRR